MEFKTKPYPYQLKVFERSKDAPYYALFLAPGLGKTKIILDTASHLYIQEKIHLLIVIAPKGLYENWLGEINTHINEDIKTNITVWKSYHTEKLKLKLSDLMRPKFGIYNLDIFLGNVDMLSTKKGVYFLRDLIKQHGKGTLLVIDESTTIGSNRSIRTKTAIALSKGAAYKRILTGTPIADSVMELPTQISFLGDIRELLRTANWYSFKNYYCVLKPAMISGRSFTKIIGTRHIDKLKVLLNPYSSIISKEEAQLNLPPKVYQTYNVDMPESLLKVYKSMKTKYMVEIEEEIVTASIVLAKIMKLRQILAGFMYTGEDHEVVIFPHNRIKALLELIELNPGKIIIWSNFIHCISEICAALKTKYGIGSYVRYDGSTDNRSEAVERFTNDDDCRFFVGNQSVGGYGLTLTSAATMIYYTNSYSYKTRLQSEDRIHRIGQNKSTLYIDMQVPNTVDSQIMDIINHKSQLHESIMGNGLLLKDMLAKEQV